MNTNKSNSTSSRSALCSLAASIGLLLIATGTTIPIVEGGFPQSPWYKIAYSAGALVCLLASLFNKAPEGLSMRDRRWHRIEGWSSLFFCAGAFFMWYPAHPRATGWHSHLPAR